MWRRRKGQKRLKKEKKLAQVAQDKHHRMPKSLGGADEGENISVVTLNKHRAYHALFQNGNPYRVAAILNQTWISLDYELIVRRRGRDENTGNSL